MTIRRVGVVGCGLMGAGIAEVCARAGYQVAVREITEELLRAGLARIEASLDRAVERGKLESEAARRARAAIAGTTVLADLGESDLIIEAVVERIEEKQAVFRELDRLSPPGTIFASNTSSLSITALGAATGRPDRVVGMHFFNPVPVMTLVELVRGAHTSEETLGAARAFAASVGKTVVVARDYPGFIVNLLLVPYLLDAVRALELGIASKEDVDQAITLGLNHPMGPLALLDLVGLDTTLDIAEAMYAELRDPRYAPPPLLRRLVRAGQVGRKSGRGFYEYPREGRAS